jgi:hypothetical protein
MKLDRHKQYACDTRTQNLPFLSASIGNPRKRRGSEGLVSGMIEGNMHDMTVDTFSLT